MRYLTIVEYGTFLGINSNCLVIRHEGVIVKEISLSHLRTIAILKNGITLSSDLVQACAIRNIKIFFLDWRMQIYSAVIAQNQHATVALRKAQFKAIEDQEKSCFISKEITYTKVKNQRSVLLYFGKYIAQSDNGRYEIIHKSTDKLNEIGIALDFKKLKAALDQVITPYDHRNLSELPDFQEINPTSEVLARTIYRKMSELLNDGNVKVARVRIGESASSRLTYSE